MARQTGQRLTTIVFLGELANALTDQARRRHDSWMRRARSAHGTLNGDVAKAGFFEGQEDVGMGHFVFLFVAGRSGHQSGGLPYIGTSRESTGMPVMTAIAPQ